MCRKARIGSGTQESSNRLRAIVRRRERERCLAPRRLACVYEGAPLHEVGHNPGVAGRGGKVKGRGAGVGGWRVGFRLRLEKKRYEPGMSRPRRHVEGGVPADSGSGVHVRPGVQQHLAELDVSVPCRPMQSRHPVALGRVDVGALPQQLPHDIDVASLGRVRYRRVRSHHTRSGQ